MGSAHALISARRRRRTCHTQSWYERKERVDLDASFSSTPRHSFLHASHAAVFGCNSPKDNLEARRGERVEPPAPSSSSRGTAVASPVSRLRIVKGSGPSSASSSSSGEASGSSPTPSIPASKSFWSLAAMAGSLSTALAFSGSVCMSRRIARICGSRRISCTSGSPVSESRTQTCMLCGPEAADDVGDGGACFGARSCSQPREAPATA